MWCRGRDNVSQSVPRDAFPYSAPSGLQLLWTRSDTLGHHDAGKVAKASCSRLLMMEVSLLNFLWQDSQELFPAGSYLWVCDKEQGKLWVKPGLGGGCCRFAITNGHDSIPIWSLEKWADGSLAVSLIRAVVGEPFWIASAFQPSESPGQSTLPTTTSFCCFDFLPFSLLCFVLSPWRGEAGGGGGKVGGGGCLASLAPPIQTSFHLK